MPLTQDQTESLRSICPNIHHPGTTEYTDKAAPWSIWADRHPSLVVEPQDIETISAVTKYLYASDLDFCVRNTGTGGSSASDVCLSMHGLKSFSFNADDETVIAGAGLAWGELDRLIHDASDGKFACVGARCTWVGVSGGTLVGGLSWLSHEFGLTSDPQNLLDAQVRWSEARLTS